MVILHISRILHQVVSFIIIERLSEYIILHYIIHSWYQYDINQSEKSHLNDFHLETKEILLHKKLVNLGVFKRPFIMLIIIFFTLDIYEKHRLISIEKH